MKNELRKPKFCPKCQRTNIKRIVGGIPNEAGMAIVEADEAVVGDCFMREWKEDWHCAECRHNWCDKTDPARVEVEKLYVKMKEKY